LSFLFSLLLAGNQKKKKKQIIIFSVIWLNFEFDLIGFNHFLKIIVEWLIVGLVPEPTGQVEEAQEDQQCLPVWQQ
jgi:hypothetical protein